MSAAADNKADPTPPEALRARARQAYADQGRELAIEQLILKHLPMVRHIVQRILANVPGRADAEDLISAGTLGLVHAARRFDPARQTEFSTYAYIRIRGAVIDELRQRSFVPTGVHHRIRAIAGAYDAHVAAHGGPPSDEQLSERAGMSLSRLYRTLEEARNQQFLSIYGLTEERSALPSFLPPAKTPLPHEQMERAELLEKLASAIQQLPEKQRRVIVLYYDRDLTMKEAAAVLNVTESRVSQLHASALFKLSMKLRSLQ